MTIDPGISDLLEGGGKTYSWDEVEVDTIHRGKVISARKEQRTDFNSREPMFYSDGNPMMQIAVSLMTDERDEKDSADDGVRVERFHGQKLAALREALKKAQALTLAVDAELAVKLTERKKLDGGKRQNIFAVQYTAPPKPAFDPAEEPF